MLYFCRKSLARFVKFSIECTIQQALETVEDSNRPLEEKVNSLFQAVRVGLVALSVQQGRIRIQEGRVEKHEGRIRRQKSRIAELTGQLRTHSNQIRQVSMENRVIRARETERDLSEKISSNICWEKTYNVLAGVSMVTIVGVPLSLLGFLPAARRNHREAYHACKEYWVIKNFPESQDDTWVKEMAENLFHKQLRYYATESHAHRHIKVLGGNLGNLRGERSAEKIAYYDQCASDHHFWLNFLGRNDREREEAFAQDLQRLNDYVCKHYRPLGAQSQLRKVQVPFVNLESLEFLYLLDVVPPFPSGRRNPVEYDR